MLAVNAGDSEQDRQNRCRHDATVEEGLSHGVQAGPDVTLEDVHCGLQVGRGMIGIDTVAATSTTTTSVGIFAIFSVGDTNLGVVHLKRRVTLSVGAIFAKWFRAGWWLFGGID